MNNEESVLVEFLKWLKELPLIPNTDKLKFTEHLQTVGKLDQKSIDFIKHVFELAEQRNHQITKTLSDEWELFNAALAVQKIPEFKVENIIAQKGAKQISSHNQRFKRKFKALEKHQSQTAETAEQNQEAAQVAALRASVGA